jgi:hypothetical protein
VYVTADPYYALIPTVRRVTLGPGGTEYFDVREYRKNFYGSGVGADSAVTSSNTAVATAIASTSGIWVRAVAPGEAIVTISYGGVDARVAVNVFDVPSAFTLATSKRGPLHVHERMWIAILGTDNGLHVYTGLADELTWTSSDPTVVKVLGPGTVQALKPGRAVVTAASRSSAMSVPVTVSDTALVDLAPSTPAVPLPVGAGMALRAYARYADGASVDVTNDVEWWTAAAATAAFDAARPGYVQAVAAGTARVECRLDGKVGYAMVTGF